MQQPGFWWEECLLGDSLFMRKGKKLLLPFFIFLGVIIGPVICVFLQIQKNRVWGWWFVLLMTVHAFIRTCETFFTSKDKDRLTISSDWTLLLTTVVYLGFCFAVVFEFFLLPREVEFKITIVGFIIYLLAYRLRWWGMTALGSQWSIHAIGEKRVKRKRLLKLGPYKYIRHPIYVSIFLDQIGLILIANTFFTLFYFFLLSIPAYLIRMILEERDNLRVFGPKYKDYQQRVGMILPKMLLK